MNKNSRQQGSHGGWCCVLNLFATIVFVASEFNPSALAEGPLCLSKWKQFQKQKQPPWNTHKNCRELQTRVCTQCDSSHSREKQWNHMDFFACTKDEMSQPTKQQATSNEAKSSVICWVLQSLLHQVTQDNAFCIYWQVISWFMQHISTKNLHLKGNRVLFNVLQFSPGCFIRNVSCSIWKKGRRNQCEIITTREFELYCCMQSGCSINLHDLFLFVSSFRLGVEAFQIQRQEMECNRVQANSFCNGVPQKF